MNVTRSVILSLTYLEQCQHARIKVGILADYWWCAEGSQIPTDY